ncbi:MAG: HEXXH motif domain-containing protein [Pseudonocardiaceae bacterium]
MIPRFHVPAESLDVLASGQPDPPTLELLRSAQLSKNLLLIRTVLEALSPLERHRSHIDAGYALLSAVQAAAPDVVDEVICHPQVGAWAVHCLRSIRQGFRGSALWSDVGHLNALAAAAAVRVGFASTVPVAVHTGNVMLPTLGAARVPADGTYATLRVRGVNATVSANATTVTIPAPAEVETADWHPLRRLRATSSGWLMTAYLDDLHPFRNYPGLMLARRLAGTEVAAWAEAFSSAWELLVREHDGHAVGLSGGLTSLVPLARTDDTPRSATCPESFGAVALSFMPDPTVLAATLVHEFQHTKLGALLNLVPLHRADLRKVFYAPWREDPRPLEALLHGTYAFLGVAGFWRVQRRVSVGAAAEHAHLQFALWRGRAHAATMTLRASGLLTEAGERFVAGMAATLEAWLFDEVPPVPARRAAEAALSHRIRWCQRHLRTDGYPRSG